MKKKKQSSLKEETEEVRRLLQNAYCRFSFVTDEDLIDEAIYLLKSLEARYSYLLKECKKGE